MNSYLEKKGGEKGVFFCDGRPGSQKKTFSLKLLDISTSALEYSSIGPKYISYVKGELCTCSSFYFMDG